MLPAFSGGWEEMPTETDFCVMPRCCQSSLLDFYNMTELPTQYRQDDGCPVHSWRGGKFVSKASEESLPLPGRRCIRGEYPTPDGSGW